MSFEQPFQPLDIVPKSFKKPEARVICDSISDNGDRLTTIEAKIHRFVLAELNTHRVFSRNSASSRAIPMAKVRQNVIEDPAVPLWWGKNQTGMQAKEEIDDIHKIVVINHWFKAMQNAIETHELFEAYKVHKQISNRILEPFMWHRVIITATDWDNFFEQRCHPDAMPEMRMAAEAIQDARLKSQPRLIYTGRKHSFDGWHLPYITGDDILEYGDNIMLLVKMSVARCARVSYLTHEGVCSAARDFELYMKLASQIPGHWSPMEHVAYPVYMQPKRGNLNGWYQHRHDVELFRGSSC